MSEELSVEQKEAVASWVSAGGSLSDVQRRIKEEFDISMTYMDVRFLVLDLDVAVQDKEPPAAEPEADIAAAPSPDDVLPGAGGVSVELDRLVKPGCVVSGSVTFSDGVKASWMLDQMGRLALDAGTPDYAPPPDDIPAFQEELKTALSKRGF